MTTTAAIQIYVARILSRVCPLALSCTHPPSPPPSRPCLLAARLAAQPGVQAFTSSSSPCGQKMSPPGEKGGSGGGEGGAGGTGGGGGLAGGGGGGGVLGGMLGGSDADCVASAPPVHTASSRKTVARQCSAARAHAALTRYSTSASIEHSMRLMGKLGWTIFGHVHLRSWSATLTLCTSEWTERHEARALAGLGAPSRAGMARQRQHCASAERCAVLHVRCTC